MKKKKKKLKRPETHYAQVDDFTKHEPRPRDSLLRAAMQDVPVVLSDLGNPFRCQQRELYSLCKVLRERGHPRVAAWWAMMEHLREGRIKVIWDIKVNDDDELPDDVRCQDVYYVFGQDSLWEWWGQSEAPEKDTVANPSDKNKAPAKPSHVETHDPKGNQPEETGSTADNKADTDGRTSAANKEAQFNQLEPADRKAYFSYSWAEYNLRNAGATRVTDPDAYKWLTENGLPDEKDSPQLATALADYKLPALDTWSKQVRNARKILGEQKYARRAGRLGGGSVINSKDC